MSDETEPPQAVEPFRLLYVCTGNSCRSPMAEVITRAALERRGWTHVEVASAGIAASPDGPASDGARKAAAENGLDLEAHAARNVSMKVLDWADLVLVMSPHHLFAVIDLGAGERAAVITDFAAGPEGLPEYDGVSDPFGGDDGEYRATFDELSSLVDRLLGRLEPILAP